MREIIRKDLSEKMEFGRCGFHYRNIWFDEENHRGIWKMEYKDGTPSDVERYEFVEGMKYKNPDGSIVYRYPSDEDFGTNGWYVVGLPEICKNKIEQFKNRQGKWA